MPIRTGLDERMKQIRLDLKGYFSEAKEVYAEAIDAFTKLDSEIYDDVKSVRKQARVTNWDLSNNLLLILAINQPLMEDLRIITTYLKTVDTVERIVRHARDIARSDRSLDTLGKDIPALPGELVEPVLSMWKNLADMIDILSLCLTEIEDIPQVKIVDCWASIQISHGQAIEALTTIKSSLYGGKAARLEIINVVNRVERSAYNLVRLADLWHFSLYNERIILDD
ncbi:MAG: hypothetical protein CMA34_04695 [Euryarchaeota archaeon]|jgi:hypothetical protein|nr:hypothetical protein [Euryarchaeota archaeon]|tara:strand:+ start:9570 stop:10247 length:678 start_codon:yes stop_codon:yes gene_type:complete